MQFRSADLAVMAVGPALPAWAAEPDGSPETPYPGITYTRWREPSGPTRIHVVEVDLSSQEIDLVATAQGERGKTPSAFAAAAGAVVAVNGDYFSPGGHGGFAPAGLARGQSRTWDGTSDDDLSGFISFYKDVDGTQVGDAGTAVADGGASGEADGGEPGGIAGDPGGGCATAADTSKLGVLLLAGLIAERILRRRRARRRPRSR